VKQEVFLPVCIEQIPSVCYVVVTNISLESSDVLWSWYWPHKKEHAWTAGTRTAYKCTPTANFTNQGTETGWTKSTVWYFMWHSNPLSMCVNQVLIYIVCLHFCTV